LSYAGFVLLSFPWLPSFPWHPDNFRPRPGFLSRTSVQIAWVPARRIFQGVYTQTPKFPAQFASKNPSEAVAPCDKPLALTNASG